jgi:beta-glucosidase
MRNLKILNRIFTLLLAISTLFVVHQAKAQTYAANEPTEKMDFKWPEGKKMAISLSFDDARLSQADKGIPLLDKYGVKATFYVMPGRVTERLDVWKKAAQNGHEMGNHSLVHPCPGNFEWARDRALDDYTLESFSMELDSAGKLLKELLGVQPVSFAYFCGQTFLGRGKNAKSYVPLIAAKFETGRGWLSEASNDPSYCNLAQLTGMELDGKSFEQIKALIDGAKSKGLWLVLAGHEINESGNQTTFLGALESLCQYALDPANEIWIDNIHNIASYIRGQRGEKPFTEALVYQNPIYPVKQRIDDLLSRMTLVEKVGQMNMPCLYLSEFGREVPIKMESCRTFAEGKFLEDLGPGGGFFTLANNVLHEGARQQAEFFNELQKIASDKTRLGIPLLQTEEGTHGLMCSGATIFPEGLAIGSTWNMGLVKKIYSIAAMEARAVGIHQLFTLVIEPNRDPRLGRNEEGFSEDPYLCSRIAETIVGAIQGNDISAKDKAVAGLCHYPGQSEPVSGMEKGAMEISERKLREVFLPPWVAGIKKAGALGVMATYPAIDAIPTHASKFLLTDILRNELNFKGLVLSEGSGLNTLVYMNLASNHKEAGQMALKAGLDVDVSYEDGYLLPLIESVNEGKVSMDLIDRSVRRILEQKFRLGLFDNPYVDPANAEKVMHTKESREVALETARQGIVLLKNEKNILPLKKDLKKIAVIGPNADDEMNQLGDYTARVVLQNIVTVLDGIKAKCSPKTMVEYVKGCDVLGNDINEIAKAGKVAKSAEIAVVVLGENEWEEPKGRGTVGEAFDVASLDLTGLQEDLLKAVYATGTPVILVLINGRPLSIRWAAEHVPGIVEAWIPGELGGHAVADIIFGDYNPSGKLPVTVPRHSGQLPAYYNYSTAKSHWMQGTINGWGSAYADMPATPLWEFGFGLSYTKYQYGNLQISPGEIGDYGQVKVTLDVKNTGNRKGDEVVQLYVRDVVASVMVPIKELKGFYKISLEPDETKPVEFILKHEDLALLNQSMDLVVEPGTFEVMVGSSSEDIKLKGEFKVKQ